MDTPIAVSEYAIVVLYQGFVYVGILQSNADHYLLLEAKNIRKWGTTKGLGQLVQKGPQRDTVLDDCGTVRIPAKSVISIHPTNLDLWR